MTLVEFLTARWDEAEDMCRRYIEGRPHDGPCLNYLGQDPAAYDPPGAGQEGRPGRGRRA